MGKQSYAFMNKFLNRASAFISGLYSTFYTKNISNFLISGSCPPGVFDLDALHDSTRQRHLAEKIVVLIALYSKQIKNIMKYTNASKNDR